MKLRTHYDKDPSRKGHALCGTGAASVVLTRIRRKVDCKRCLKAMEK